MLSVNIWEGATLFQPTKLLAGQYGHAALSLPGAHGEKDLYISWWPGRHASDRSGKSSFAQSVSQMIGIDSYQKKSVQDRRFIEDMWSENQRRYHKSLLFTIPMDEIDPCMEALESLKGELGAQLAVKLDRVRELFEKHGKITLSERLHFAVLQSGFEDKEWGRDGEWIIDDEQTKTLYFIRSSHNKEIHRVFLHEGHKHLFSEQLNLPRKLTDDAAVATLKAALARHKAPLKSTKGPAKVHSLCSNEAFLLMTDKNDYFIIRIGNTTHFYHWTREYVAPTVNIAIPTLGQDKRGLDDQAIRRWWQIFTAHEAPQWSTFDCNCSVIVATALNVGGAYKFASPPPEARLLWNPTAVRKYAEAVAKGISGVGSPFEELAFHSEVRRTYQRCEDLDYLAKSTPMWEPGIFRYYTDMGALAVRPQALKEIDKIMMIYWDAYKKNKKFDGSAKSYGFRTQILGRLIERLANFSAQTKEKKRLDAVVALGEMVIAERAALFSITRAEDERKQLLANKANKSKKEKLTLTELRAHIVERQKGATEASKLLGPKLDKAIAHR